MTPSSSYMARAGAHWVILNPKREPVKCHKTAKAVEKAKDEVSKLDGYEIKEIPVTHCPFCNPKPKTQESGQAPEIVTLSVPELGDEVRPGQCHDCRESRAGQYKLKVHNRVLLRICKDCGAVFDLEACKPWEG